VDGQGANHKVVGRWRLVSGTMIGNPHNGQILEPGKQESRD
jgi:hypothetical protein